MKILFVEPYAFTFHHFRNELFDTLIEKGYEVVLCIQQTDSVVKEYSDKVKIYDIPMNLKNKNPFTNLLLRRRYRKIIKTEKPDCILSFTIKPNLYCARYAENIPMIANITGLGNVFKKNTILKSIVLHLYRRSFKNVDYVFFQNTEGLSLFKEYKVPVNKYEIIPGSGVNVEKFKYSTPKLNSVVDFLFASRPIKEKGFDLLIEAIPKVIEKQPNVHFTLYIDSGVLKNNKAFQSVVSLYKEHISIMGVTKDTTTIYGNSHFTVLPSFYHEGVSNVLLESLSCGRPIITTNDNSGCKEVLQESINGYGVKSSDLESLVDALIKAANTNQQQIEMMGKNGRDFVSKKFNRKSVVNKYIQIIEEMRKANKHD